MEVWNRATGAVRVLSLSDMCNLPPFDPRIPFTIPLVCGPLVSGPPRRAGHRHHHHHHRRMNYPNRQYAFFSDQGDPSSLNRGRKRHRSGAFVDHQFPGFQLTTFQRVICPLPLPPTWVSRLVPPPTTTTTTTTSVVSNSMETATATTTLHTSRTSRVSPVISSSPEVQATPTATQGKDDCGPTTCHGPRNGHASGEKTHALLSVVTHDDDANGDIALWEAFESQSDDEHEHTGSGRAPQWGYASSADDSSPTTVFSAGTAPLGPEQRMDLGTAASRSTTARKRSDGPASNAPVSKTAGPWFLVFRVQPSRVHDMFSMQRRLVVSDVAARHGAMAIRPIEERPDDWVWGQWRLQRNGTLVRDAAYVTTSAALRNALTPVNPEWARVLTLFHVHITFCSRVEDDDNDEKEPVASRTDQFAHP